MTWIARAARASGDGTARQSATPSCPSEMKRPIALGVLALGLVPAGCLTDAPALEEETDTSSDTDVGTEDATSPTSAPEDTGTDADADADATASADGSSDGTDGSNDDAPCDDEDPECMDPGATVWTFVSNVPGYDAAYAIAAEGDRVLVVGERNAGRTNSAPWAAQLAGADGSVAWDMVASVNVGHSDLRAVVAVDADRSLAAGNTPGESVKAAGYLEGRDAAGESGFTHSYSGISNTNYLLGLLLDDAGGFHAVGYTGDFPESTPLLLHYTMGAGNSWNLDTSSDDTALFADYQGQLFGVDVAPNGNLVLVGSRSVGDFSDAMVLLTTPDGQVVDESFTGGDLHDGFVDVDVDAAGNGIAVGRVGTEGDNGDLLMLHFTVGDALEPGWEHAWGDAISTNPNGFARDGDTVFVAAGMLDDPDDPYAYDSLVLRWDGDAAEPTWAVPFEASMPGGDYAMDVALFDDETIVACGVVTGKDDQDAWVRRLAR